MTAKKEKKGGLGPDSLWLWLWLFLFSWAEKGSRDTMAVLQPNVTQSPVKDWMHKFFSCWGGRHRIPVNRCLNRWPPKWYRCLFFSAEVNRLLSNSTLLTSKVDIICVVDGIYRFSTWRYTGVSDIIMKQVIEHISNREFLSDKGCATSLSNDISYSTVCETWNRNGPRRSVAIRTKNHCIIEVVKLAIDYSVSDKIIGEKK